MTRVLLLAKYDDLGASSRVRFRQYLDDFKKNNIDITIQPLFSNKYVRSIYSGKYRLFFAFAGYFRRTLYLVCSRPKFSVIIVEKEVLPFFPRFFEKIVLWRHRKSRVVVDYDDAVFHRYDLHRVALVRAALGQKIDRVMHDADIVMCGNKYLANRAQLAGAKDVEIIPTAVDIEKYFQEEVGKKESNIVIGWIGSPGTSSYLVPLLPVFERAQNEFGVKFIAIGANANDFKDTVVDVVSWSESSEIMSLTRIDVGIMPLPDSPWERGKCGYKLIQYMACGKPVIASPVGVNKDLVDSGVNGFLADDEESWFSAIATLCSMSEDERSVMGEAGRELVRNGYSTQSQLPKIVDIIRGL